MQIGLGLWLGTRQVGGFSPATLFAAGQQGGWYDPSDLTTMFQDTAGTVPVTAAGQTVGLLLDKSGRGNHLTQATAASRPIYGIEPFGGRRNLLTFTEQFDNAAWQKANITATADTITITTNANNVIYSPALGIGVSAGTATASCEFKAGTASFVTLSVWAGNNPPGHTGAVVWVDLQNGQVGASSASAGYAVVSSGVVPVGGGWFRAWITATVPNATIYHAIRVTDSNNTFNVTAVSGKTALIRNAQMELGALTPYQRVTDQWNVTQAGVPSVSYVQYDGTDDWFISPTITPGIDKAQVFAGVRKLRDTTQGAVVELSSSTALNNGAFLLAAPDADATATYGFDSKGTVQVDAVATGFATPVTSVVTGLADISGDSAIIRVNGVQVDADTGDQGTGNFLAYPLYVGRRNTSPSMTLPFSGRMYQMIVRFGANLDAATITATETYVNSKTGAYV